MQLGVRKGTVVIAVTYDVNPGDESRQLRAMFDRNADGRLDSGEQTKLQKYLERMAMLFFKMRIGDRSATLIRSGTSAHRVGLPADASQTMGVSLLFTAYLPKHDDGELLTIGISDRGKDAKKHIPLIVDVGGGWTVALASQGEFHPESRQIQRIRLNKGRSLTLKLRLGSPAGARLR